MADHSPNSDLSISETLFDQHIAHLAKFYKVVSINDLAQHINDSSDKFVVAITFDDGYKDNLTIALPILERYSIPATVYVTTCFPEGNTSMWWFELWDHIKKINELEFSFKSKEWKWRTRFYRQKVKCFHQLEGWFKTLDPLDQNFLMEAITNTSLRKQYPNLCLTWDEINTLDANDLITIGAHSHTHPNLKVLDYEEAYFEIKHSKALLEKYLGRDILHFAYPFGTVKEAGEREFELVKKLGFLTAVTTQFDHLDSTKLNSISRVGVENFLSVGGLNSKLSGWEHFARRIIRSKEN